jgi:hypothetical protein
MISVFLGVSFQIASGEDSLKINAGALEINNISAERTKSLIIFKSIGDTADLVGPEADSILKDILGVKDGYVLLRGFATVGDKVYGYYRENIKIPGAGYIFIKVKLEVNNVSDSTQTFRVGDIALLVKGLQVGFMAVGPNKLAYLAKDKEDLTSIQDVVYNLEPNDTRRFTYVFSLFRKSRPWILSYKEEELVELKVKK